MRSPAKQRQNGRPFSRGDPDIQAGVTQFHQPNRKRLRVGFVHLDLGIGGAEQLVVLAAKSLSNRSAQYEQIQIVTAHHELSHCFEETRDGTLKVTVYGDWLPRTIAGRAVALCSSIRMAYIALMLVLRRIVLGLEYDVLVADQVATLLPLLRFASRTVFFYGHFPDQLLCVDRKGVIKRVYRFFMDEMEKHCILYSDLILVNSNFSAQIYRQHFSTLSQRKLPTLYPPVDLEAIRKHLSHVANFEIMKEQFPGQLNGLYSKRFVLSLNRYEMKKALPRAIDCYLAARTKLNMHTDGQSPEKERLKLVIAGGFDPRIPENRSVFDMLKQYSTSRGLVEGTDVVFLKSVSDLLRWCLLHHAIATIYTPDDEHFGIVPVESMAVGTPVIASDSGGPRESVLQGSTGYLCCPRQRADDLNRSERSTLPQSSDDPPTFEEALIRLLDLSDSQYQAMQRLCRHRASSIFGLEAFADKLHEHILRELQSKEGRGTVGGELESKRR